MKSIKGTKTEQNLLKSFAGESQARTRYTFFAQVAKEEGYELCLCVGFGYPNETPAAKPRDRSKVQFVE